MTDRNYDGIGWGLFFIWIGICYLVGFSFAVLLLGAGIIIVCVQLARKFSNLKFEIFWFIVGLLGIIGGLWSLLKIQFELIPFLIILAGVLLLVSALVGKKS